MSASRAERRRNERQRIRLEHGDGGTSMLSSLGHQVKVEGPQLDALFARTPKEPPKDGRHQWVLTAAWLVNPATWADTGGEGVMLDLENMLTVAGPGCYWCEREYSTELAALPCVPVP